MIHRNVSKAIVLIAVFAVLAFGFNAFAGPGAGYSRGMAYGPQADYGYRTGYSPGTAYSPGMRGGPHGDDFRGYGYAPNLSKEELEKIEQQRNAFFEATRDIRQALYSKRLELRSEMAKKNADGKKASELQKEISDLGAQLGQQQIAHQIEMRKINPNLGRGFGDRDASRFGRGSGGSRWR